MRASILFAALPLLAAAAPAGAATRAFTVGGFERIAASGSADVIVTTGARASVVAEGPQERLDRLQVDVVGGELRLREESRSGMSWSRAERVTIRVTTPAVTGVALGGSGDMTLDRGAGARFDASVAGSGDLAIARLDSPAVALRVAGSGNARVDALTTRAAALSIAGSGNVDASGAATQVSARVAGSGNAKLGSLRAQSLSATVSGAGNVEGFATDTAELRVSGSGNVTVHGGARCTISRSGSGSARCIA